MRFRFYLVCVAFFSTLSTKAQSLLVTLTDATIETFALSDIQSIKFSSHNMVLHELDGTVITWTIDDIDHYAFDGLLSSNSISSNMNSELIAFPTPSLDIVNIKYTSPLLEAITIEVYDQNGRMKQELFKGDHLGETQVYWSSKQNSSILPGQYLIKLTKGNKIITKPVIIQ